MSSLDLRVLVLERWRRAWDDDWSQRSFVYGGGSGAGGRVALWQTANQLTSDPELYYDVSTNRLGIGTTATTAPLTFSNALGPKIDIYNTGGGRYGIELQSGQMHLYAEPAGGVRLGNMDVAGTTFAPRFDVSSTFVYSSVPMGVLWGANTSYDFTTNRLLAGSTSYIAQLGVQVTPEPASYAIATNGIHCYAYSRFETSVTVGGQLDVGGAFHVYAAGTMASLRLGDHVPPGYPLDVNGQSIFRGLVGISYAPDPGYWLRCPSAYLDSIYVGGAHTVQGALTVYGTTALTNLTTGNYVGINGPTDTRWQVRVYGKIMTDGNTSVWGNLRVGSYLDADYRVHVDPGGYTYIGNQAGIYRGPDAGWGLCVGGTSSIYADGNIQSANTITAPTVNGNVGVFGTTYVGWNLQSYNVYSATNVYAVTGVDCNLLNVRSGNSFFNGGVGIGWGNEVGFWLTVPNIKTGAVTWNDTSNGGYLTLGGNLNAANVVLTVNGYKPGGGAWADSSYRDMKEDITPIPDALDVLLAQHGRRFRWREPQRAAQLPGVRYGLIEDEVTIESWRVPHADGGVAIGVEGFEALAIEAFRTLAARLDALEAG